MSKGKNARYVFLSPVYCLKISNFHDGSIHVCIDPSQTINKAMEVPKYPIPTVDTLLRKLNNANFFFLCGCVQGVHKH